jgi:Flp pilus assembly pilin Flp
MALSKFNTFVSDESGAVTVDWVVLTAAIVGLGLAVMSVVSGGIEDLSGNISNALTNTDPLAIRSTTPTSSRRLTQRRRNGVPSRACAAPAQHRGRTSPGAGLSARDQIFARFVGDCSPMGEGDVRRKRRRHPSWVARGLNNK